MVLPLDVNPGDTGHVGDHEEIHALLDPVVDAAPFTVAMYGEGILADRPAAGVNGRIYSATDTDAWYVDNGTTWKRLVSPDSPTTFTEPQQFDDDAVFNSVTPWVDSATYCVATGGVDDAAKMQEWLDACLGASPADPATNTRRAVARAYQSPGIYKFNSVVGVRSVLGFVWEGAGRGLVRNRANFTGARGISLNGLADCRIGGFSFEGSGTEDLTVGIQIWWDNVVASPTQAARSTGRNVFFEIQVSSLVTREAALRLGATGFSNQVDSCDFYSVYFTGGRAETVGAEDTVYYQAGVLVGHSLAGNNYLHNFYGVHVDNYRRCLHILNSFASFYGATLGDCEIALYLQVPVGPVKLIGGRSENAERLVQVSGAFSGHTQVTIEHWVFSAAKLPDDGAGFGYVVDWSHRGQLMLKHINITDPPVGVTPQIRCNGGATSEIVIDDVAMPVAFGVGATSALNISVGVHLRVESYHETNSGGQVITTTTNYYTRGLHPGSFTTAGRPAASSVPAGTVIVDTTLNKIIHNADGANWRDAMGTVV